VPYHYGIYQRANGLLERGWLKFVPGLAEIGVQPEEKAS